jgi:hypothetical protein
MCVTQTGTQARKLVTFFVYILYIHRMYLFMRAGTYMYVRLCTSTPAYALICILMYIRVYSFMHNEIFTYIRLHLRIYLLRMNSSRSPSYTYIHIYIHTYMHACMHTYIRNQLTNETKPKSHRTCSCMLGDRRNSVHDKRNSVHDTRQGRADNRSTGQSGAGRRSAPREASHKRAYVLGNIYILCKCTLTCSYICVCT